MRPEHVYWNVGGIISFAPNANASGLFLGGKSITANGAQFGIRQLLATDDVLLTDLSLSFGTSAFYSATTLASALTQGCTNPTLAVCDNQIVNGDFENYFRCPRFAANIYAYGSSLASDVCNFFQIGAYTTPDYFNGCAPAGTPTSIPQNYFTTAANGRTAHSGTGYLGATSTPGIREYFGQEIPALSGGQYYGEFWVSLASDSRESVRELGMNISSTLPTAPITGFVPLVTPKISGTPGPFPNTADFNWHKINGFFTAAAGDKFITLGCFLPDGNGTTNFDIGPRSNTQSNGHHGAYYFYDDLVILKAPRAGPPVTSYCSTPATIGEGCPLPNSLGTVTYQWSPTTGLTNPNQLVTQASPSATTVYTLTITVDGKSTQSSVTVTVSNGIPNSAIALGTGAGAVQTLSASTNFSGNYVVSGDLLLTNGTYTLTPGTTFYFNNSPVGGEPTGKIILGNGATLRLNNATMRGTCNSWYGIVLSQNYANTHLIIENNSLVSNAKYGVMAEPWDRTTLTTYDTQYTITNSRFEHNLTHVYDESAHRAPASSCSIISCNFTSDPQLMLAPYNNPSTNSYNNQITYQALFINPYTYGGVYPDQSTTANSGTVNVNSNNINTAVYGILNQFQDRNLVNIANNTLTNIYTIGIWKAANPGYNVADNVVILNGSASTNTAQISPSNPVTGIDASAFSISGGARVSGNSVVGDNAQNQTAYKEQIGIVAPFEEVTVRDNTLSTLSSGTTYRDANLNLFSNRFTNCLVGVKLIPYDQSYGPNLRTASRAQCNTFERTSGFNATTYGIWAPPQIPSSGPNSYTRDAYFPDLGTNATPYGNSFSNISNAATNNGNNPSPTYWRFNSSQEAITPSGFTVNTSSQSPTNACQNAGALNSNGVNRQALVSPAFVQSLMDSVRFQQVSVARQRVCQGTIIQYFSQQNDLRGLDQYAAALPLINREAVYTFNLYLLRTYTAQHQSKQAQRARQQLLALASNNSALRQEIALLDLLLHADTWLPAGGRLPVGDSLGLARIAASGTTVAEQAATWLRYYYPHAAPYRESRLLPGASPLTTATLRTTLILESELYPNPATGTVVVRYRAVKKGQTVGLQLFDLLTSRQVMDKQLPVTAGEATYTEATIDLYHLPAGQYSYRFVVSGKAQAAHHLVIQK